MLYRLPPLAERDLEETWRYVADAANVDAADRLLDAIVERLELLVDRTR